MPLLEDLLATLLPGDQVWPDGSVAAAVVAGDLPGEVLPTLAAVLPGFVVGDEAALRRAEAAEPVAFGRLVTAAYLGYYAAAPVRAVLAAVAGYEDRPPQPLGYAMEPFDPGLLARQRIRAAFWRDPGF